MKVTQNYFKWQALMFEVNKQKDSSFHHEDGYNEWLH
jgi:hypothetical protein